MKKDSKVSPAKKRKEFVLPFRYIYVISLEMLALRIHFTWFLHLLQITSRGKHKGAISKTFSWPYLLQLYKFGDEI
jgi:hypothetical protein